MVYCGESGDDGSPFPDLHSNVGGLISGGPNKTTQISGTRGDLKPEVVEVCLGALDYRGFQN